MTYYLKKTLLAVSTVALLSAQSHASSEEIEVNENISQIIYSQNTGLSESLYQDIIVKGQKALAFLESKLDFVQSSCEVTRDRLETYPENKKLAIQLEKEEKVALTLQEELATKQELLVQSYLEQCESLQIPVLHGYVQEEVSESEEDSSDFNIIIEDVNDIIETSGPALFDVLTMDEMLKHIISYTTPYSRGNLTQTCVRLNSLCEDYSSKNPFIMFKEIDLNYTGTAFGKVVGNDYWMCREQNQVSQLMVINGNRWLADVCILLIFSCGWFDNVHDGT